MPDQNQCPQCGTPIPAGVLAGLCPACLLHQGAAHDTNSPSGSKQFEPPPLSELARLFPQLEILGLIGSGGMGAVYRVRQPALDRVVALKVLTVQAAASAGFAERFTREARALARLSHPSIVALYEFGQADGLPYLIMEYVEGVNLRQLERVRRLSPREVLQIVPQICDALQYAHDEGVVHRDIKPENVMVDRKGRVKITDFGLAKLLGVEPAAVKLTHSGQVVGTPHYMAPEQVERPLEVDHRADIFSLGVVFYEMLTGELPLGRFAPPSHRVQVDVRLDEVVLQTLEKEPSRRYQRAQQVKTAVEDVVSRAAKSPGASSRGRETAGGLGQPDLWLGVFMTTVCAVAASAGIRTQDFLLWLAGMLGGGTAFLYFVRRREAGQSRFEPRRLLALIAAPGLTATVVAMAPRAKGSAAIPLLGVCLLCMGWAIVTAFRVREFLQMRGIDVGNPIFMGPLLLFRHVPQYREITRRETGGAGPLFHHWLISINAAWITAALALVLHKLSER